MRLRILTLAARMALLTAGALWADIDIRYVGPASMHCSYWIPAGDALTELRVEVEGPAGSDVIAQASNEGAPLTGNGQAVGLAPGEYTCKTRTRTFDSEAGTWSAWGTVNNVPFRIDGTNASGWLLFDETLGDAVPGNIIVPDGIALTLSGTLTASTNANAAIAVMAGGSLATFPGLVLLPRQSEGIPDIPVKIQLTPGHTLSEIQGGFFVLLGAGSSFDRCRDIRIAPYADVSLTGITNGIIDLSCLEGGATLTAKSSTLCSGPSGYGECRNGTVRLNDVLWNSGFEIDGHASVEADGTTFNGITTVGDMNNSPVGEEAFHAADCRFGSFSVSRAAARSVTLMNCLFSGEIAIFGGAPEFTQCEFGGKVRLQDRNATILQGCRFLDELLFWNTSDFIHFFTDVPRWYEAAAPSPLVSGNAFLGDSALRYTWFSETEGKYPPAPIAIGANYYGSAHGYFNDYAGNAADERGFLPGSYRARVHGNDDSVTFGFQPPLQHSPVPSQRRDARVFPSFWVNGHIAGQNTIDHRSGTFDTSASRVLLKGRDTLLALDLSCTEETLGGARVYAEWNGRQIEALPFSKNQIRRDPATFSPPEIRTARSTWSIILPGVQADSMPFSVYLDASKVSGFDPEAYPQSDQRLLEGTLSFKDQPQRPLNIWVLPVKVSATVNSWGPSDPTGVAEQLKRDLPNMLPLPAEKLRVEIRPCISVWSPLTIATSLGMLNRVSTTLAVNRWLLSGNTNNAPDFIVAVMPNGIISRKSDGVSFALRRRVLFVDEQRPSAGLHELGHAIGLCTDTEEYDDYPPNGIEVESATQFDTATQGGLRIKHIAGKHHAWYDPQIVHFDIMGAAEPSLPATGWLSSFYTWFCENLGVPGDTATASTRSATLSTAGSAVRTAALPDEGLRRILVSGATDHYYAFRPETVAFFDITPLGKEALAPASGTAYRLEAYDGNNALLFAQAFTPAPDTAEWMATFDVPSNAVSCRIVDVYDGTVAKWVDACGLLSATLELPLPGSSIGQTFEARWRAVTTGTPAPDQVRHTLYYRRAGSDTWELLAGPTVATNLSAYSDMLPEGGPLALKLITSDGLSASESTVEGLTVSPRAPLVAIRSPAPNEQGVTNAIWRLTAGAVAFPAGSVTGGVWSSSLQGVLGQGSTLNMELLPGEHRLRYVAAASNGLSGADEVTVQVAPHLATTDLGFLPTDLTLGTPDADPNGLTPAYLVKNATNSFNLILRNRGADVTGRMRLFLRQPDGEERLAATCALEAAPFETKRFALETFIDQDGSYTLRAVLDEVSPADPDLANNERQWTYTSVTPRITLLKSPPACGTVTGDGLYLDGATVTVGAAPSPGYVFVNWTEDGAVASTEAHYSFAAAADRTLTALFRPERIQVSLSCSPSDYGTVAGDGEYAYGATATVVATPNAGFQFLYWAAMDESEGGYVQISTEASYSFVADSDRMLRAYFGTESAEKGDLPLADAVDAASLSFTSGGSLPWLGKVTAAAKQDGAAARSGTISNSQSSWMQTTVTGPGTLSFWWRVSSEAGYDKAAFLIDGSPQLVIDGETAWASVTNSVGAGTHTFRWKYEKDFSWDEGEDCAWVDAVSFSAATAQETQTTPVPVPYTWLDAYPTLMSAFGSDYESAALADTDNDGHAAWEEYVSGTDPTNRLSVLTARLSHSNGTPYVTWSPDLGTSRLYTVVAKTNLTDAAWNATNAASRFFRIHVQMP